MNKVEMIALLCASVEEWNEWREENPDVNIDLSGANFKGKNLSGADLSNAKLIMANLARANLTRATLRGANLSRANLTDANLTGVDLTKANLAGVAIKGAKLSGANLTGANLDYSSGFSFSCGSFDAVIDKRIAAQMAYHFCRMNCDDPMFIKAKTDLIDLANEFHRVEECGEINKKGENNDT